MTERYTILCVDDEIDNVELMIRILQETYDVLGATSGAQALEILKTKKVQAIIADQRMPGMSGLELLHQVRRSNEDTILIMVTGYADIEIVSEAINLEKIQGYFQKPIRASELILLLRKEFERFSLLRENRQLLAKTLELNGELEKLNHLKSDFLRMLSHELRTPLNAILGSLELMDFQTISTNELEFNEFLQVIRKQSDFLERLLVDVLYLLEIENLGLRIKPVALGFRTLVNETLDHFKSKFDQKSLHVDINLADNPMVLVDQNAISRVFQNILLNAIEFSDPGGCIRIGYAPTGKNLRVWISDSGKGINPDFHDVFEKFRVLNSQTGRSIIGTGINLAIAKTLIEAHGCSIGFETRKADGNVYSFELPLLGEGSPKGENPSTAVV